MMLGKPTPLLSVVIPTHERPQYLPRAIDSALLSAPDGDVEVIVVPNGVDESWKVIAKRFKADPRLSWQPIVTAHANAARNHGAQLARGKFIRFLDDDDNLHDGASRQLMALESLSLDASSGSVSLEDDHAQIYGTLTPPDAHDFTESVLHPRRLSLPTAHIFRSELAKGTAWNERTSRLQDVEWLIAMAAANPGIRWSPYEDIVGSWVQHAKVRTSPGFTTQSSQHALATWLLQAAEELDARGQLTPSRRTAAARGLWNCAHRAFQFSPLLWTEIARKANQLDPTAGPEFRLFGRDIANVKHPLALEWIATPPRLVSQGLRRLWHHATNAMAGNPCR